MVESLDDRAARDGQTFRHGQPQGLFEGVYSTGIESGPSYDVHPVTGRLLLEAA